MDTLEYKFKAEVQQSSGRKATYFFVLVPEEEANHISHFSGHLARGFKSLKVDVVMKHKKKKAEWRSSIFPSDENYLLLVNKTARQTCDIGVGDKVDVAITILDL